MAQNQNAGVVKVKGKVKVKKTLSTGDYWRDGIFFALAGAGLGVSLPHLASEVSLLTGAGAAASWFLAITIDLGLCATKAHISAGGPAPEVSWTVLSACTVLSIALNCHAFLAHCDGDFGMVAAIGFGMFLPLFILALSYLGSEILLGHKK